MASASRESVFGVQTNTGDFIGHTINHPLAKHRGSGLIAGAAFLLGSL